MKVSVTVVPTQGASSTKSVTVDKSGASLEEVLKAAGVETSKRDFLINGKPATLEAHVGPDQDVQVRVLERPQGS